MRGMDEMIQTINSTEAPQAIGPYAQAVRAGNYIYLSGQLPINPKTNNIEEFDIKTQTKQILKNIQAILKEEKLKVENIVKTTIFLKNMNQFTIVNEEYSEFMGGHLPARSTVEVSRLPKDALIEIEVIAYS